MEECRRYLFSIRRKTTACSTSFRFAQAPRLILTVSQILFSIRRKTTACSTSFRFAQAPRLILNCFSDTVNDERLDLNLTSRVGVYLSSRTVSSQVFSARQSLTSVFGMGTGGPSAYFTPTSSLLHLQGLEPWTHWLRVSCSTNWAKGASSEGFKLLFPSA